MMRSMAQEIALAVLKRLPKSPDYSEIRRTIWYTAEAMHLKALGRGETDMVQEMIQEVLNGNR
jgi:hypothetical protein